MDNTSSYLSFEVVLKLNNYVTLAGLTLHDFCRAIYQTCYDIK